MNTVIRKLVANHLFVAIILKTSILYKDYI
jgi:hypothetical protein